MKLALLLCVLITSCIGLPTFVEIDIKGKLSCSKPFYYQIYLVEEDLFWNEMIGEKGDVHFVNGTSTNYHLQGEASDVFANFHVFQTEVEPRLVIHHTCTQAPSCTYIKDYCCVCIDWHRGGLLKLLNDKLEGTFDIDLETFTMDKYEGGVQGCDSCYDEKFLRTGYQYNIATQRS
ncbi:hypothetical protein PRIPAC_75325 [Pristionchus pacificus]|uniref:Uncharacterized protein n=1 Tax=Pristionchus pacificus TaxID=54126 RepID=A0A2A6C7G0_PRIPA|nr:hypothetical protein PRIPAC_75325 [Pristionchus pacificus]|eukprot:PDM73993.1 hypothetical protein PRIPAC_41349 [Pristionchus pacificus]